MAFIVWWAGLAAYLTGYAASLRPLAERTLDNIIRAAEDRRAADQRSYPRSWELYHPVGELLPSASGRIRATWYAAGKAIFWPIVIPVHLLARTVVTPTERQQSEKRELERLRKLAADEGLKWPEETR